MLVCYYVTSTVLEYLWIKGIHALDDKTLRLKLFPNSLLDKFYINLIVNMLLLMNSNPSKRDPLYNGILLTLNNIFVQNLTFPLSLEKLSSINLEAPPNWRLSLVPVLSRLEGYQCSNQARKKRLYVIMEIHWFTVLFVIGSTSFKSKLGRFLCWNINFSWIGCLCSQFLCWKNKKF